MQHSVKFYSRHSCQIWYPQHFLVSRYWAKFRWGYFQFLDFRSIPYKRNCHNFRTSDVADMKLGPVTKLDKRNKSTSKNLTMTSCQKIVTSLAFFIYVQPGTVWKPDSGNRVCKNCSLIVTFYLTKTKNRTKTFLTQLSQYCFE